MRILYDHQAFTIQEYGGISRYFFELARELRIMPDLEISSSILFSNNEYIKEDKAIGSTSFFNGFNFKKKTKLMLMINELKSSSVYKDNNFDVFHPTYYHPYYAKIKSKKPIVLTFHDLIHEKFMKQDLKTLSDKKSALCRADAIIAISQNTKNDIVEYYGIPEKRVTVIHLASSYLGPDEGPENELKGNYLLYIGNRNNYKNFKFFVKAIAPLLLGQPNLALYCAGDKAFTKEEQILLQELHIINSVKHFPVSDENLGGLYSNALAFFFPSTYEGFGIPLLEAMNCGCPIGASQTGSLPEVAGDAALYFDPYDESSILAVAETLITTPSIRSTLRQRGYLRSKEFSWAKTAQLTYDLYRNL